MLHKYRDHLPQVGRDVFIAPGADVIGDVTIGDRVNIWYGVVIRGDMAPITIGEGSNIQDLSMVHVDFNKPTDIGKNVTIGHSAIIHACTIGDNTLIGMGATILDGAKIGKHVIIGANSLVSQNKEIPDNSLVFGSPAKVIRTLSDEEIEFLDHHAITYQELAKEYLTQE